MTETLKKELSRLAESFDQITPERKATLQALIEYVLNNQRANETVRLNFICTHNSRRSHMAQLWAAAAAIYSDLDNIECYSGGTEVTRIHPNALQSLEMSGFTFSGDDMGENPRFLSDLGDAVMLEVFSKTYDDEENPKSAFAAIMVCSSAEKNCPFVAGAEKRISITYDDPKEFDGEQDPMPGYRERSLQIGLEMLYVMQSVSKGLKK